MKNILLALALFAAACTSQSSSAQGKLDPAAFAKGLQQNGVQLVDVRTSREFTSGHLEGALNIDISSPTFASDMAKLDKKKPVYVYCAVGGRSASAAAFLQKQGFESVYDLTGGISAWQRSGQKVVK